jgi:hypothetical protein
MYNFLQTIRIVLIGIGICGFLWSSYTNNGYIVGAVLFYYVFLPTLILLLSVGLIPTLLLKKVGSKYTNIILLIFNILLFLICCFLFLWIKK